MKDLKYRVVNSIDKIDRQDWDSIFGNIPEGYDFYKTLEESRLEQFHFSYILIYESKRAALIAPLFIADLNLDIAIGGEIGNAIQKIRKLIPNFFVLKTLFCGSPFRENGILGLREALETRDRDLLVCKLVKTMETLSRRKGISFIVFKDFLKNTDPVLSHTLKSNNFLKIRSLPSSAVEISFTSLDGYFKSLSYSKRKDLRRKLQRLKKADIKIRMSNNVEDIIDDIYALYLNTYRAGKIKFERLTKDFFINITKNLKGHAKFFLYYVNDRLAAFNLCFIYKDLFIDKFIGFDYDLSYKYSLYHVSWCHNIELCLKESIPHYQTGQTDYGPKTALGAGPIPLYAYAKHRNVFYNIFLNLLAKFLKL